MTHRLLIVLSILILGTLLAGCSNNKGVTMPNNTAAAAVPPSPQVTSGSPGGSASNSPTGGNPSFAK
ncbi:MAG: hypothetical protein U0796_15495 [Gemmatales bacterium]